MRMKCGENGKRKCPERPASVPDRCIDAQRPGRGADPRFPLGPPLMLSPVALPGTVALDGILGPVPLADPSGREETYGPARRSAIGLSTDHRESHPRIRMTFPQSVHAHSRRHCQKTKTQGPADGKANPEAPAWADGRPTQALRDRSRTLPRGPAIGKSLIHIHVHN